MKKLILVVFGLGLALSACSRPQVQTVLIAAGGNHTCALGGDGGVKCWGSNEKGQLGNGSWTDNPAPVAVGGLGKDIIAVTAGGRHTCALAGQGHVRCWGGNESGQLGNGTQLDSPLPVDVQGLADGVVAVAAGDQFTCALSGDGRVRCWGNNARGQVGDGTLINRTVPVDVAGLAGSAVAIAAGGEHACALLDGGAVQCWGANRFGQLGNKTRKDSRVPVDVSGLGSASVALTAGSGQTCALSGAGGVKCWGWNGNETENHLAAQPEDVSGLGNDVTAIAAGAQHTCALTRDRVECWGSNYVGQLGSEALAASSVPVTVIGLGGGMLAIATGAYHTCVLSDSAGVECWGQNYQGELGDGSRPYSATPVSVVGLRTATFASLTATAAPSSTPAATPTRVPPTLAAWPMPTAPAGLLPGQPVRLIWLHMLDAGHGWGIDATGHILRTSDGGNRWKSANPPDGLYNGRSFFPVDARNAWAVFLPVIPGAEGCERATNCHLGATLWHTTDSGNTWQANKTWQAAKPLARPGAGGAPDDPASAAIQALAFADPATGWFLVEDRRTDTDILSVLARTSDAGKSLREIWRDDGIARYTGLAFLNKQVGYLGLDNTTFFDRLGGLPSVRDYLDGKQAPYLEKTSDGGWTWESTFLPRLDPIPAELQRLASSNEHMLCGVEMLTLLAPQAVAAQISCHVSGGPGPFHYYYLSPDGGEHWHSWIATGSESFLNPAEGWRLYPANAGQAGQFQQTSNGGQDWVTLANLSWQSARFDFVDRQTGWAIVTGNGATTLERTADGGRHWTDLQPEVANP